MQCAGVFTLHTSNIMYLRSTNKSTCQVIDFRRQARNHTVYRQPRRTMRPRFLPAPFLWPAAC